MIKKVAILTINDDGNYGNRLQNYAVQTILQQRGLIVETISNKSNLVGINVIKKEVKKIIKRILKRSEDERYNCFMSFNRNIKFSKYKIDKNHIPNSLGDKYDYFFTGSDQVWNPNFGRMSDIDFLTFAPKEKRNSISASFGISNIPDEMKEYYKDKINCLNNISVREERGKEIIKELTGRTDVEVLIDPTMMLKTKEWDKVLKRPKQLKTNKYVLNYFLGELSEERKNQINKIAKENKCEIINILDKNSEFYKTGPSEFLYLEKNAFLICTDSFHSSVFAILYNKPFIIFEREDKNEKMNSRIETLISKFNLKDRKYNEKNITRQNLEHDYSEAYKLLEIERKKVDNFLNKILK